MRLATELRRLREAAGLSSRQAAALLGVSPAQITHIESGLAGVSEKRLRRLTGHYGCADEEFVEALVALATDRTRGWWERYRGLLPSSFLDLAELDHHASFWHEVSILHVPGLLQTEDYSRAVFANRVPELGHEELELRVRHRMERRVVFDGPAPLRCTAVLHEVALRIRVSDRASSRAQLDRLLELSQADHITLRVIPLDLDGFNRAGSSMTYVGGPVSRLDTVIRDAPHASVFVDSEAQLSAYRTRFRKMEALSLDPGRSRDLISRLAKEL